MRIITVKYQGECKECGAVLEVGTQAEYEKTTGIFCVGHFPTDPEKIREFRLNKKAAKAARYEEWAEKREKRASAVIDSNRRFTSDLAFCTQPGHIPLRARIIAQNDRAYESLCKADEMRAKAESMKWVQVKGDAAKRDEDRRAYVDSWIKEGMIVDTCHYGELKILKVNKKTVRVQGRFGTFLQDKSFLSQIKSGES